VVEPFRKQYENSKRKVSTLSKNVTKKYNERGLDASGYDAEGYNDKGFNKQGIHRNGSKFDRNGYDNAGYNEQGFNRQGIHRNGTSYDKSGYNKNGYNKYGYNKQNRDFKHKTKLYNLIINILTILYSVLTMCIAMYCAEYSISNILEDDSGVYLFLMFLFSGLEFIPLISKIRNQYLTGKMKNIVLSIAFVLLAFCFIFAVGMSGLMESLAGFLFGIICGAGSIIVLCVLADEKVVEFIKKVKENLK